MPLTIHANDGKKYIHDIDPSLSINNLINALTQNYNLNLNDFNIYINEYRVSNHEKISKYLKNEDNDVFLFPIEEKTNSGFALITSKSIYKKLSPKNVNIKFEIIENICSIEYTQYFDHNELEPIELEYFVPIGKDLSFYDFSYQIDDNYYKPVVIEKKRGEKLYEDDLENGKKSSISKIDSAKRITSFKIGNIPPNSKCIVKSKALLILNSCGMDSYLVQIPIGHDGKDNHELLFTNLNLSTIFSINGNIKQSSKVEKILSSISDFTISGESEDINFNINSFINSESLSFIICLKNQIQPRCFYSLEKEFQEYGFLTFIEPYEKFEEDSDIFYTIFLIIDCSGSMQGNRIQYAKECANIFLRSLPEKCKYEIILFGSTMKSITNGLIDYSENNIINSLNFIPNIDANYGGTNLKTPIEYIFQNYQTQNNLIFLMTDGQVENKNEILDLVSKKKNEFRFFTLGISSEADKGLVEGIASNSNGNCNFVYDMEKISEIVINQLELSFQTLMNIEFQIDNSISTKFQPSKISDFYPGIEKNISFFNEELNFSPNSEVLIIKRYNKNKAIQKNSNFISINGDLLKLIYYKYLINSYNRTFEEKEKIIEYSCKSGILSDFTVFYCNNSEPRTMQIFIKTLTGKHIPFDVSQSMKMKDLKDMILKKEGIPLNQQRLIFAGLQLKDENTIFDYYIRKDSTIHMVLIIRGGGPGKFNFQYDEILKYQEFDGGFKFNSYIEKYFDCIDIKKEIYEKYSSDLILKIKTTIISIKLLEHEKKYKLIIKKSLNFLKKIGFNIENFATLNTSIFYNT